MTETAITITIGGIVLDGVIYDPVAENLSGGGNTFDNGDITYCEAHHNMAVFYAQTDNPVLSVDVIPIGRVTSDLSVFENLESRVEITFSLAEQRMNTSS